MADQTALKVRFEGYFLCRLTTDPDPTDEPRGVSGYTLALAGEANLDNWIQLNPSPEYLAQNFREPGPTLVKTGDINLGVKVTATEPGPDVYPDAARLIGLPVNLLPDPKIGYPKFEGRNDIVGSDDNIAFAIDPIILDISSPDGSVRVHRQDLLPGNEPIWRLPPEAYAGRVGQLDPGDGSNPLGPLEVIEAIGVYDFYAYFRDRSRWLRDQMARTQDPDEIEKYRTRLNAIDFFGSRIRSRLGLKCDWTFGIGGGSVGTVSGLSGIDVQTPWPVEFWLGGFDGDLMIGYMRGTLSLPFQTVSQGDHA
jgi:hypothetical protein